MSEIPWFKVDDNLAFHHKVVAAGNPAIGLWARAGSLCAQQLTDGFIPDHMIAALGTKAQAEKLVTVGLWDREQGGYRFHGWAERQPSKVDVEAERAAAKERMREYRAKRKGTTQKESPQVSEPRSPEHIPNERRTNGEVRPKFGNPDPSLSQSHPDPPTYGDESPSRELAIVDGPTSQTLVAEWIDHCAEKPPSRVIGHVAKEVKTMLDDGIAYERVRRGLAEWNGRDLHPSTLPSIVHGLANRAPTRVRGQQATDDIFERAMERAIAREAGS